MHFWAKGVVEARLDWGQNVCIALALALQKMLDVQIACRVSHAAS